MALLFKLILVCLNIATPASQEVLGTWDSDTDAECSQMMNFDTNVHDSNVHLAITNVTEPKNACSCMTGTKDSIFEFVKFCRLTPCNANAIVSLENCSDVGCKSCAQAARTEFQKPLSSMHLLDMPRCYPLTWTDQNFCLAGCPVYMKDTADFMTLGCDPADNPEHSVEDKAHEAEVGDHDQEVITEISMWGDEKCTRKLPTTPLQVTKLTKMSETGCACFTGVGYSQKMCRKVECNEAPFTFEYLTCSDPACTTCVDNGQGVIAQTLEEMSSSMGKEHCNALQHTDNMLCLNSCQFYMKTTGDPVFWSDAFCETAEPTSAPIVSKSVIRKPLLFMFVVGAYFNSLDSLLSR